jgi:lipopolysaccharide biosynthesis regulator YciM
LKLRYETKQDYITHLLGLITTSKHLITCLQAKADQYPSVIEECGEMIQQEKEYLNDYYERLKEAYALPNNED